MIIPQIGKNERVIYNETEEPNYQKKVEKVGKDRRSLFILIFILLFLIIFSFIAVSSTESSFNQSNPDFWHILILDIIVFIVLIYWVIIIKRGFDKSLLPLVITNSALYIPRRIVEKKGWNKILIKDIKRIDWDSEPDQILVFYDNSQGIIFKSNLINLNNIKKILNKVKNGM
jgi:cellulose synthase/poly-beta-1,6-N-acetylglucosamine synthase-like glycosyltransferase